MPRTFGSPGLCHHILPDTSPGPVASPLPARLPAPYTIGQARRPADTLAADNIE
jgi:hypothetical protein